MKIETENQKNVTVVALEGEVDLNTSPQLRSKLKEVIAENGDSVCVDLKNVAYIDSSGIATLIEAHKNLVDKKRALMLCSIPKKIYSVFELAKLDMVFDIYPDREAAIKGKA